MFKIERPDALLVIIFLGVWGTFGLYGIFHLIEIKTDAAQISIVVALIGPILGAMAGILTNSTKPPSQPTSQNPMPVELKGNTPDNPVYTDPQADDDARK